MYLVPATPSLLEEIPAYVLSSTDEAHQPVYRSFRVFAAWVSNAFYTQILYLLPTLPNSVIVLPPFLFLQVSRFIVGLHLCFLLAVLLREIFRSPLTF
jgi:hypothetical protein